MAVSYERGTDDLEVAPLDKLAVLALEHRRRPAVNLPSTGVPVKSSRFLVSEVPLYLTLTANLPHVIQPVNLPRRGKG